MTPPVTLDVLLRESIDPRLPSGRAAEVQAEIRREIRDPSQIADSGVLPPDHPLRAAAQAVRTALNAVTSGPVTSEQIALAEIPRSSPLAPWKMLVRAIDAIHRGDHALCERCAAAIGEDSPAARLVPALRAMMGKPQALSPAAAELVKRVTGGWAPLRSSLERLDAAYAGKKIAAILAEIKTAMALCREADPELAPLLLQRISVRSMLAGLAPAKVTAAAGQMSIKDSRFWHLLARATERERGDVDALLSAGAMWLQFRNHAVAEGRFERRSPAAAAVLLHIADILEQIDPHTLNIARRAFMHRFDGFASYYRGQPKAVAAAGEFDGDFCFLDTWRSLEAACEADPCTSSYDRWLRVAQAENEPRRVITTAEAWTKALPGDIPPWLALMKSAEERNALQKAFKYMERAEQIDGLNAQVRSARLRLLIQITARHFRTKKHNLVRADLEQIDALPQAKQGDRPALFLGFRELLAILERDSATARQYRGKAAGLLGGEPAGFILAVQLEEYCGTNTLSERERHTVNGEYTAAFARVCALAEDLDLPFRFVPGTGRPIAKIIASQDFRIDAGHLAALGEVALRSRESEAVHAASARGLRLEANYHGRFLFLRARNLPGWEFERITSCVAAAGELARRNHDDRLIAAMAAWRSTSGAMSAADARAVPDAAAIAKIIQREISARHDGAPPPPSFGRNLCQCPECRARREEAASPFDDVGSGPPGLEDVPGELIDLVNELGPEKAAQMLVEMLGLGGGPPGGRGRRGKRR